MSVSIQLKKKYGYFLHIFNPFSIHTQLPIDYDSVMWTGSLVYILVSKDIVDANSAIICTIRQPPFLVWMPRNLKQQRCTHYAM